jgi:hypothetical protein
MGRAQIRYQVAMNRTPVDSSNIVAVGYDSATNTLEIEFKPAQPNANARVYRYEGVPLETFERLLKAESKGSFFSSEIRGRFQALRVEQ